MKFSKQKLLLIALIISSLVGYLEWNGGNNTFLFEAEYLVFSKLFSDPISVLHPFKIIPLAGQILILISIFQKNPSKKLVITAIASIGLLFIVILLVGILSKNYKILLSVVPFLIFSFFTIKNIRINK